MPELPEVESTVRYLSERVANKKVVNSDVRWARTIATHSPKDFSRALQGTRITSVSRRGKFIDIVLQGASELHLFVHLRMSGSLDVIAADTEIATHDRIIIYLQNGKSLRFNDTRKFGRMYLCESPELITGKLGVEPLSSDFSPEVLYSLTRSRKTRMKALLLEQKTIAGLGNIYVDESLWKAKIHPCTPAGRISLKQCAALYEAITTTLTEAISLSGTDFGDGVVDNGMYSPLVYARDGTACIRCNTKIRKTRVQQRGTHYCPKCQRAPR
ncbi:MAG: DNA-formamidopyrimidine glycosylase [Pseudomonadota bacterium]|jgi:formamidopyrimidine-DNA glycosylase